MIEFEGRSFTREDNETVLDCLLRHGVEVGSFCRSGACQACVLKATFGGVPALAQVGLNEAHRQQGFFLSCVCRPDERLVVERCDAAETHATRVARVTRLSADVLQVWLQRPAGFAYRAGQFVQLVRPGDGLMRPYSLASAPEEEALELHVAVLPNGKMSGWLAQALGQAVHMRGPFGDCFYQEGEPERALLLAGTGTGLAPLAGIVKAAIRHGHRGEITVFHGAPNLTGLYLRAELEALAEALPALQLVGSVPSCDPAELGIQGRWRFDGQPLDRSTDSCFRGTPSWMPSVCTSAGTPRGCTCSESAPIWPAPRSAASIVTRSQRRTRRSSPRAPGTRSHAPCN